MISIRQKDILLLLAKNNEPITAEWIAKELRVSDRTIRKEIKELQADSSPLSISIESVKGKGYQMHVHDQSLFLKGISQYTNADESAVNFSEQNSRVLYLLKRLLLEKEFTKLEQFEDEMFVSKSTIQNDLKLVRNMLDKYNLALVTRPHYGIQVTGDEYRKRLCFSNYILNMNKDLQTGSLPLLDDELFEHIKKIIIKKVNVYKIDISDISLVNLTNHILIACKRIEKGFVIEKIEHLNDGKYPFERIVATEILMEVETYTNLVFPESEIDYIMIHLLGTKLLLHKDTLDEYSEFDNTNAIVECMLERLRAELNWDFREDIEFRQALTLHIRPAMNRLRFNMNIRNPLLNEIKIKYPGAFEGAVIASKCMEEYLSIKIDEHEIAYIALHLGVALERKKTMKKQLKRVIVVCASGVGSAKLLFYKLQRLFERELEIVDSINFYNLADYDLTSIDLIISTVPINVDLGVPVQVVHTFLEEQDVKQIKENISILNKETKDNYLDPSRVFLHQDLHSKEEVISLLSNELYKQGLVSTEYVQLVVERESIASTCFGNLVAIPHPSIPETETTFWTVCTLKRPIKWHDNQMVQLICLLNIQKGAKGDLENMYQRLIKVIEDKSIVQKIIKSKSINEVIALFS
jgi:lichenan operon transcriptional antiterminator